MSDYPTPNQYTGRISPVRLIVVHSTETPTSTARSVAKNFQDPARRSSAHWIVGTDATVSGVAEADTAWAAPGANHDGIQVEQCGYAASTDWTTGDGATVVSATARLIHDIATRWSIPIRHLTNAELAAGQRGIVTHAQVSAVYKKSDHTDPGPAYPMATLITQATDPTTPTTPTTQEDPEMIIIKSPNRAATLVGPATFHVFRNSEELAETLNVLRPGVKDTLNDRQYDVIRAVILAGTIDAATTDAALTTLLSSLDTPKA